MFQLSHELLCPSDAMSAFSFLSHVFESQLPLNPRLCHFMVTFPMAATNISLHPRNSPATKVCVWDWSSGIPRNVSLTFCLIFLGPFLIHSRIHLFTFGTCVGASEENLWFTFEQIYGWKPSHLYTTSPGEPAGNARCPSSFPSLLEPFCSFPSNSVVTFLPYKTPVGKSGRILVSERARWTVQGKNHRVCWRSLATLITFPIFLKVIPYKSDPLFTSCV